LFGGKKDKLPKVGNARARIEQVGVLVRKGSFCHDLGWSSSRGEPYWTEDRSGLERMAGDTCEGAGRTVTMVT